MGEGIRCLKSLAVWDTTHKYERVVVGVLCVHYSRLSLFLPICFLFEPVVDCTTHKGTGEWSLCIRSGRFPPNSFLFDRVVVRWIQKYSWLKTNLFWNKLTGRPHRKLTSYRFSAWVFQEQLISNDRLFWENSDTLKWSFTEMIGQFRKFWHTKMIVWGPQKKTSTIMNVHFSEKRL